MPRTRCENVGCALGQVGFWFYRNDGVIHHCFGSKRHDSSTSWLFNWRSRYSCLAHSRNDFSNVTAICLDETSRKRGHNYVTVFADAYERKVLFAVEGKGSETISAFRQDFELRGGKPENVTEACLDMSEAFKSGLKNEFPMAQQTFDNFHIVQLLNKAVDEVRRQEQKSCPDLKGTRYIWLKNEWNRTEKQSQRFNELREKT